MKKQSGYKKHRAKKNRYCTILIPKRALTYSQDLLLVYIK